MRTLVKVYRWRGVVNQWSVYTLALLLLSPALHRPRKPRVIVGSTSRSYDEPKLLRHQPQRLSPKLLKLVSTS